MFFVSFDGTATEYSEQTRDACLQAKIHIKRWISKGVK
jgi:hypothetical protein